ncbi:NAD-dependent epimerase [Paenibacillus agaridevorans]|uniref:NAD-dependent epimerase n=1 Tax=Paenibacillus agaridevorans TaxID=171404 RepID=A0A2R5ESY3_9BACL|nr:NAD-dependent epimerase/dehydratase family protein [Paenibacillus agaridevorans]GBG08138.1 NAD-dependent epimerase [Paenibacillus agaridevorans]
MSMHSRQVKNILITAKNSYIGNSFAKWVKDHPEYTIEFITCRNDEWKESTFTNYDVILHVAGIAHVKAKKYQEDLYYKINTDLTIAIANKAKSEGVKQFIFLSSMIVYGESNADNQSTIVNSLTPPHPYGYYGDSKRQAEIGITYLQDENFNISIIRPPMIYGLGSKGNFPKLAKIAKFIPVFPKIDGIRSMLYIDNLCEFIRMIIKDEAPGVFHPQNTEYVNVTDLFCYIRNVNGKKTAVTKLFNPIIRIIGKKVDSINKLFGTFVYEHELSKYDSEYCITNFKDSIRVIEGREK